ncbi:MAG: hypothetical protein ABSB14_19025 [Candidatus Sulfotelmatobacter sp.]
MKPSSLVLLVPIAFASFGLTAMAQQPSAWRQTQKTDAAAGTEFTRFTLAGKFVKSPQGNVANGPTLALDCVPGKESYRHKSRFVGGNLVVGSPLKIHYVEPEEIHGTSYYPKVSIQYRLDGAKEEMEKWSPGTDKTSAPVPTSASIPVDAVKKMLRAHTVEITAEDAGGLPVVIQFDMPDPAAVEEGCNVDEPKK